MVGRGKDVLAFYYSLTTVFLDIIYVSQAIEENELVFWIVPGFMEIEK